MPTMDELLEMAAQQGDAPGINAAQEPAQDPALSDEEGREAKVNISRAVVEGFVVYEKLISDVEITPEPTNPVKKKHEKSPATRLKAVGGHLAENIKIDDLRMFCVRNQIKGARKASKLALCRAIAEARVKHDNGEPLPYIDCFIPDEKEETQPAAMDVELVDGIDTKSKKRARDDFEEAASMELSGDGSIHLNITDRIQQSKLITLQSRIAQSVEVKNMAVYLKETIESASAIRREIREERVCRDALWEKLVAQVGDESVASSEYIAYRKSRQEESEAGLEEDDGGFVKPSREQLLDDIFEEDTLIQQLKKQHVKLTEAVSKLV